MRILVMCTMIALTGLASAENATFQAFNTIKLSMQSRCGIQDCYELSKVNAMYGHTFALTPEEAATIDGATEVMLNMNGEDVSFTLGEDASFGVNDRTANIVKNVNMFGQDARLFAKVVFTNEKFEVLAAVVGTDLDALQNNPVQKDSPEFDIETTLTPLIGVPITAGATYAFSLKGGTFQSGQVDGSGSSFSLQSIKTGVRLN